MSWKTNFEDCCQSCIKKVHPSIPIIYLNSQRFKDNLAHLQVKMKTDCLWNVVNSNKWYRRMNFFNPTPTTIFILNLWFAIYLFILCFCLNWYYVFVNFAQSVIFDAKGIENVFSFSINVLSCLVLSFKTIAVCIFLLKEFSCPKIKKM